MRPTAVTSPRITQSAENYTTMKKEYIELLNERKWKAAFDAMPLGVSKIVIVQAKSDLRTIPVRASEFNRDSETKRVSVSVDLDQQAVTITVNKK